MHAGVTEVAVLHGEQRTDGRAPVLRARRRPPAYGLHHRFVGDTPLGGTRTTDAAMRLWWERLDRLFPGDRFAPESVVVQGPPARSPR